MSEPLSSVESPALIPDLRVLPGNLREFPATLPGNSRKWTTPQSSREIAEILVPDPSVPNSIDNFRRNVTNWYPVIRDAYCWLPESDLRTGSGKGTRYTPLCCEQMESLMQATTQGCSYDDWIASVRETHAVEYAAYQESQPVQTTKQTPVGASVPSTAFAEAELVDESGSVELASFNVQQSTKQIQPLFQVNIQSLQVTNLNSDTSQVQTETAQLDSLSSQLAGLIGNQLRAEGKAGIQQVRAEIQHTVSAVKAQTLHGMLEELQQGKPPEGKPTVADDSGTTP